MTEHAALRTGPTVRTRPRPATRTGPPRDRKEILEQVAGWTLTIVVAMLIAQLHLM